MEITAINIKLQNTDVTSGSNASLNNNRQTQNDTSKDEQISTEDIAQAIEKVNKALSFHNKRLQFSIHDKTKQIMVKVVDELTGEVIREIPPKKVLDMVAMTWEEIGLLVDEKV